MYLVDFLVSICLYNRIPSDFLYYRVKIMLNLTSRQHTLKKESAFL